MKYETTSWSIEVSKGWVAQKDEECISMFHPDGVGSLQISDYQNKHGKGRPDDLAGFIADEKLDDAIPLPVIAGEFSGLTISSGRDGRFMKKWFLLNDSLMLYVTYNCKQEDSNNEVVFIESMLQTLKSKINFGGLTSNSS
jgi:hypothetical protein